MEYLSAETQKLLNETYKTTAIIVVAFLASVIVFMVVARFIPPPEPISGSEQWLRPIYYLALLLGLSTVIVRRIMLSNAIMSKAQMKGNHEVIKKLMSISVICAALGESVAIIGLMAYMLTSNYDYSWRLGVISILLVLYSFPRRGEWVRRLAKTG